MVGKLISELPANKHKDGDALKILIVEDEALISERLMRLCRELLGSRLISIKCKHSLDDAMEYIEEFPIDLLLLDLNLDGQDGFDLLKQVMAGSFQTVIVSANTHRAIEAFEYGVIDFISKPVSVERLRGAISKVDEFNDGAGGRVRFLSIRKGQEIHLLEIADVDYIKGSGIYTDIHMVDGTQFLHNKPLSSLQKVLPSSFLRIHKSYIVNLKRLSKILSHGQHRYECVLVGGETIPMSRAKYREIKLNNEFE